MNKNVNINDIIQKSSLNLRIRLKTENKNKNKIINISKIKNDILNLNHYYNLIKSHNNINTNKYDKIIENNLNNLSNSCKKQKYSSSYEKLQKEIKQINNHIYNNNSIKNSYSQINKEKRFIDEYNNIINSVKCFNSKNDSKNLNKVIINNKSSIKENYYSDNSPEKNNNKINDYCQTVGNENIRSIDYFNSPRKKFLYENYALNTIYFNHPKFYILNNINYNYKEKLPLIESTKKFKFKKRDDLTNLIPKNTDDIKLKDNFYKYYIRNKFSQRKFNL